MKSNQTYVIDIVLCPPRFMCQNKDQKNWKMEQNQEGQNINVTYLNGESKSHNIWKTHFTENLTKTLIGDSQKVDFLIRPLDHVEFWTVS